jgi:hypothetical protein
MNRIAFVGCGQAGHAARAFVCHTGGAGTAARGQRTRWSPDHASTVAPTVAVSYVNFRVRHLRPLPEGEALRPVENGRVVRRDSARERITNDDRPAPARLQTLTSLVRWAVLETSGQISFIPKES